MVILEGYNMINYIWFFMIAIGILIGIINGRMAEVSKAIVDSARVQLLFR